MNVIDAIREGDWVEATKNCSGAIKGRVYEVFRDKGEFRGLRIASGCTCINDWVKIKKGRFGMESLKKYFENHQDSLITLAIIIVLDHFLFNGALRTKIQTSVEKLLDTNCKKLAKK